EVGMFFTVVNVASIPITYLIGRFFNEYPLKTGLILIDVLDGIAHILYGFATGVMAPFMLFAGCTVEEISAMFYPLYQAYEQIIYPKEKYEEVFAWHLRLPEVSQLFDFLFLGYLFGYVWNTASHYRLKEEIT
ncbi:MAG: MFS transporter, partial [Candidatus Baldrarchaeia archaeon]